MAGRCRLRWPEFSIIPPFQHFVKQKVAQKINPQHPEICA
jgi:hypothetical protein